MIQTHKKRKLASGAAQTSPSCAADEGGAHDDRDKDRDRKSFTRSQKVTSDFQWKTHCFICNLQCRKNHKFSGSRSWSHVKTLAEQKGELSMYNQVLQAAESLDDREMITRLRSVPHGDLVAVEARYHRGKNCFKNYLEKVQQKAKDQTLMQSAVILLIAEFCDAIIKRKEVFLLTTLKERFKQLASDCGIEASRIYICKQSI